MTTFESILHPISPAPTRAQVSQALPCYSKDNVLLGTQTEIPDPVDFYLKEQECHDASGFMKTILKAFETDPRIRERYQSPVKLLLSLLNRYGRFWIDEKEVLWYRDSQARDHKVEQLLMGPTPLGDQSITRVNGQAIPTICLGQLKQLLSSKGPKWQSLIEKLDRRRPEIEASAESLRSLK